MFWVSSSLVFAPWRSFGNSKREILKIQESSNQTDETNSYINSYATKEDRKASNRNGFLTCICRGMEAMASDCLSIQGPTVLALAAKACLNLSLFCCLTSSACSTWSRWGTNCFTSVHLLLIDWGEPKEDGMRRKRRRGGGDGKSEE